jgi:hypothetical protein
MQLQQITAHAPMTAMVVPMLPLTIMMEHPPLTMVHVWFQVARVVVRAIMTQQRRLTMHHVNSLLV